jgi:glycosyltransferase involved in cell wall biosynthesis
MPLVSVVIPTHNRPEMLAEAITSIRAQTFTDYEIIIVSNGESDDMRRASREVATAHDGGYFALRQGNVSGARNFGVEHAKGEWIAFLDDDDLWLPNKLERQVAEAQRTGADIITCDFVKFSRDGCEVIDRPRPPDGWSYLKGLSHQRWWMPPSTTMVRKRLFNEVGDFDPHQRYGEDTDLWRRMSWHHAIYQMDEVLARRRRGHASLTQHERIRMLYDLRHFFKMHRDTPLHLHSALPHAAIFVLPRLVGLVAPMWLLRLLRRLRPRTRWKPFRHRLRLSMRVRAWIHSLGSKQGTLSRSDLKRSVRSCVPRRFQIEGFGETRPAEIALEDVECIREALRICDEEIWLIDEVIASEKIPYPARIQRERPRFVIRSTEVLAAEARRCKELEPASSRKSGMGWDWFSFPGISGLISHLTFEHLHKVAATIQSVATAGPIFVVGDSPEALILKYILRKGRKKAILVAPGYGRTSTRSLLPPSMKSPARGSFVDYLLADDLASCGVGAIVLVDDDGVNDDLSLLATVEVGIPTVVCGRSRNGPLHVSEVFAKGPAAPISQAVRPKISVVTVSFNQSAYLEAALKSVLDQGYPNLEYIVVDGGSTEGSVDIIKRYRDRLSAVLIEPDQGQSDALNKGFALATGDIMTWVCSDDMLEPRSLERIADAYIKHGPDLIVGGCVRIGETRDEELLRHHTSLLVGITTVLEPFDVLKFTRSWERGNYFFQPEVFFSRRIWEAAGGYVKKHLFYAMDYDLWLRMALAGASVHHVPFAIACSRVHAGQKTRSDRRWYHQVRQIIEEHRDAFLHLKNAANAGRARDSSYNHGHPTPEFCVAGAATNSEWSSEPLVFELLRQKLRGRVIVILCAIGFLTMQRDSERWATAAGVLLQKLRRRLERWR